MSEQAHNPSEQPHVNSAPTAEAGAEYSSSATIEQQLEAAVQAGDMTEAMRLTNVIFGSNKAGSSENREAKQATDTKESILAPNKLYEVNTSKPETLEVAGTKLPIVAAINVERSEKPSASYLVADVSSLGQAKASRVDIGNKTIQLDRDLGLGTRQRAKYVVLAADSFSSENQGRDSRSGGHIGREYTQLYPNPRGAAGIYLSSRKPGFPGSDTVALSGDRAVGGDQEQLMTIQIDSVGKLFIKTTAGDPSCKVSVHSELLRESASKPTFTSAEESPGFGYTEDVFGQVQDYIDTQNKRRENGDTDREIWGDFSDRLNNFINSVYGDPAEKASTKGRDSAWDKEAQVISQENWEVFAEYPEERDAVVDIILTGRRSGMSDRDIYRSSSMALHKERQNGADPEVIDRKEKILRTVYDKNEGEFKGKVS